MSNPKLQLKIRNEKDPRFEQKLETIKTLLNLIEFYNPILTENKEIERLRHYADVIQEDITYLVESIIREKLLPKEIE